MAWKRPTDPVMSDSFDALERNILECRQCPRLVQHTRMISRKKTRRFAECSYHGGPVAGFGDAGARMLVVGLAPAAHGGNRTGRMFTGDSSGDWLMRAMHKSGFASMPASVSADDGLVLYDAYVSAAARCAPPKNMPTAQELRRCSLYLQREIALLANLRLVVCLGRIAYGAVCRILDVRPCIFGHLRLYRHGSLDVMTSYHPSRQNTQTGRLTWEMWNEVFARARRILDEPYR